MKKTILGLAALSLLACTKENEPTPAPEKTFGTGVFIVNEGVWGSGESTLSHLDESNKDFTKSAFLDKNGFTLGGDVFQSMTISGNKAFMVINNGSVVEVADATTLASIGQITGITSPRYMAANNGLGYVSDWASDNVYVIDLTTYGVLDSIAVGSDPENMLIDNDKLYVANSAGGFGSAEDSTISIIDLSNNTVVDNITVGDGPASLQMDANGDLWVLCTGFYNATAGKLVKVDLSDNSTIAIDFPGIDFQPVKMTINAAGDKLYYLYGGYGGGSVYEMSISSSTLPTTPVITREHYGLGVHPTNNMIYGGVAPSFSEDGWMIRYDMNGSVIDSFNVGIGPNGFNFIN